MTNLSNELRVVCGLYPPPFRDKHSLHQEETIKCYLIFLSMKVKAFVDIDNISNNRPFVTLG